MKIVSIDPGGTTGYAIGEDFPEIFRVQIAYGQKKMNSDELYEFIEDLNPSHLICENFTYRNKPRTGLDLTAPKLIGVVELYATRQTGVTLYMQPPGLGWDYFTDKRIKDMRLYQKGLQHGRDALRHMLYWITFGKGFPLMESMAGYKYELVPEEFF